MNMTLFFSLLLFFFIIFAVAEAIHGSDTPVWRALSGMLSGGFALLLSNLLAPLTGVAVHISALTVLVSLICGVPGALLIVLLNAFFV